LTCGPEARELAGDLGAVAPEKKGGGGKGADTRARPGRERKERRALGVAG
jgi:hypothetical protein